MTHVDWILILVFISCGALTFLRLVATERRNIVQMVEAERLARQRAEEEERRKRELEDTAVVGVL